MSWTLRAFEVIDLLAQPPYEVSLSTITGELDLAPTTLRSAGYVEQERESKRYSLAGKQRRSAVYQAALLVPQQTAERACRLLSLAELKRIREAGYAVDNEERSVGPRCIASPIRDGDGVASFSMRAPAQQFLAGGRRKE